MKPEKPQKSVPVASIVSLGGIAPEFDMPVSIPRLGAEPVIVVMKGKGMRKSEWLKLRDEQLNEARGSKDTTADEEFSFVQFFSGKTKEAAELVCKAIAGWELEDTFSVASLVDMEDMYPGSLPAILSAYDSALLQGRLGN